MARPGFSSELWIFEDPPWWLVLLLGVLVSAAAFAARLALDPWLGNRQPYTPAFAAVAVAGWIGGWRTGLVAAITAHAWANFFFVNPRYQFTLTEQEIVGAASYYLIVGVILFLGHRATTANRRLRDAMHGLHRVDERRAHFLAVLGHELRNPLAAMRSALDLMQLRPDDARIRNQTQQVLDRQVGQVSRLVDDLLDLSRVDRGQVTLQREPVALGPLLEEVIESAQAYTAPRRQVIRVEHEGGLGTIAADRQRMAQVFSNLLHNASKFSPQGGTIRISGRCEGDTCAVSVRDWGEGIVPERLEEAFEPFVQLVGREAGNDGMGLGLSVVRRLVALHGGQIAIHSEGLGKGTEVVVTLPTSG